MTTDWARYGNPIARGVDLGDLYGPNSDENLRKAFAWITRTGAGRRFGSVPIGWYQQHQIAAIDALLDSAKMRMRDSTPRLFRLHQGQYQAYNEATQKWTKLDWTPSTLFARADKGVRS